jgi:hypothetical protein
MGGNRFFNRIFANSMEEAYKEACDNAEDEYGHQEGYSGEINSTTGCTDLTENFKKSKLSIREYENSLEEKNALFKGTSYGICLKEPVKNTNKIKTTVEDKVLKGTRVWKMWYVVYNSQSEVGKALLKADAIKIARAYTEKTKQKTIIIVEKRSVQNDIVAEIRYKESGNERPGEYVFFGIAPC